MVMFMILVTLTLTQAQPHEYNNHYYVLSNETDYWQNAKPACERQGGYLVSINDDGERDFLYDLYDQLNTSTNIWIGLRGKCYNWTTKCDTFVWEDGNRWNSFNWYPDYPTTGRYTFFVQIDKETKQWKNVGSRISGGKTSDKRFYICEFVDSCTYPLNPCQNGGLCSPIERWRGYECNCTYTGYNGTHCEAEVDECASNPCVHGTCNDLINRFMCQCNGTGFDGVYCQNELNECESNPCLRGECIDAVNQYMCNCSNSGYTGTLCETEIDECVSSPCVYGSCINELNRYTCDCEEGYSGVHSESCIDECLSDPCLHGSCVNGINEYMCNCSDTGYNGTHCEQDVDECVEDTHRCLNGTCVNSAGAYTCTCNDGYDGQFCQDDINECLNSSVCGRVNCTNVIGGYSCDCREGFYGHDCALDIDECLNDDACHLHGTCTNTRGNFTCECHENYVGNQCQIYLLPEKAQAKHAEEQDLTSLKQALIAGAVLAAVTMTMLLAFIIDDRLYHFRKRTRQKQASTRGHEKPEINTNDYQSESSIVQANDIELELK